MSTQQDALIRDLEQSLDRDRSPKSVKQVLTRILRTFDCTLGTVHRYDEQTKLLELLAQEGLPDGLLSRVTTIPIGKGMAGLAAERKEPVQVCNLQTDASGVAKPRARETNMEGCISLPMLVEGELRGTLGVAKPTAYDFSDEERERLLQIGSVLGRYLSSRSGG